MVESSAWCTVTRGSSWTTRDSSQIASDAQDKDQRVRLRKGRASWFGGEADLARTRCGAEHANALVLRFDRHRTASVRRCEQRPRAFVRSTVHDNAGPAFVTLLTHPRK